jgi:calcineurin-like phosphoesterase family protein
MIYVSSDYHFNHYNVIQYDGRPYFTVAEMNNDIIRKHNEVVKPEDEFFFLGDFMFKDWRNFEILFGQMNGNKHIVWGNHDNSRFRKKTAGAWKSEQDYLELKYQDRLFVCCHYPFLSWKNSCHRSINLHGHTHGNIQQKRENQIDVGIMNNGYYPFSIEQIWDIVTKRTLYRINKEEK